MTQKGKLTLDLEITVVLPTEPQDQTLGCLGVGSYIAANGGDKVGRVALGIDRKINCRVKCSGTSPNALGNMALHVTLYLSILRLENFIKLKRQTVTSY